MTDRVSEQRTILESELFLEGKRRERRGFIALAFGLAIATGSVAALLTVLPLKDMDAFVVMVD